MKSSTKPMAFGNILFGGLIGAGVDTGTGAAYDYPPLISVEMGQTLALPAKPLNPDAPTNAKEPVATANLKLQTPSIAPSTPAAPAAPVAPEPPAAPAASPPSQP